MERSLNTRILSALRDDCRIRPEDLILVGVSGGVDSVFLLSRLKTLGQPVLAAVFDHGLRPEAAEESDFVAAFCAGRGIPCFRGSAEVSAYAAEHGMGIEAAARELRYRFLFDTAVRAGAAALATAHHANDQAETVLMHILRGSGIDGLCGMRPYGFLEEHSQTVPLIRPLLGISRKEIEEAAREDGLRWCEDASNRDGRYTRNRLRNDLIPKLEVEYNPQIVSALCRLAENAAADKEILDDCCSGAARSLGLRFHENGAAFGRQFYPQVPEGSRLRMLHGILRRLKPELECGYPDLKGCDDFFLMDGMNRSVPFHGTLWLRCEGDRAEILKDLYLSPDRYPQLSQGWTLRCETRDITEDELPEWLEKARRDPETAVLDGERTVSGPVLRTIRPGERFDPYGMAGRTQKLSDLLINSGVPREYRAGLAVAADDAGILWIPGLRTANRCAVRSSTRRIIILKLVKGK